MRKMSICLVVFVCMMFLGGIALAQEKGPIECGIGGLQQRV